MTEAEIQELKAENRSLKRRLISMTLVMFIVVLCQFYLAFLKQ